MRTQPTVDIKTVMSQLMERLSRYAAASPEVLPEFLQVEAFTKFSHAVVEVIRGRVFAGLQSMGAMYCGGRGTKL